MRYFYYSQANYERKPLEEMRDLAEEEEILDEDLDEKDHPIAGIVGLKDQLTGGNDIGDDQDESILEENLDEFEIEYNSEEDLDKLLDEELDDLGTFDE